jgi:hypothetical protein
MLELELELMLLLRFDLGASLASAPQQPSLPFWDKSRGHVLNLYRGLSPSSGTSEKTRSSTN